MRVSNAIGLMHIVQVHDMTELTHKMRVNDATGLTHIVQVHQASELMHIMRVSDASESEEHHECLSSES